MTESQASSTITKTFLITPEQSQWLFSRPSPGGTTRKASDVIRELIAKAMAEEAQQANDRSNAS